MFPNLPLRLTSGPGGGLVLSTVEVQFYLNHLPLMRVPTGAVTSLGGSRKWVSRLVQIPVSVNVNGRCDFSQESVLVPTPTWTSVLITSK